MKPIQNSAGITTDDVLYHSAFGFARVSDRAEGSVGLRWERDAEKLPRRVSPEVIQRVYLRCTPEGFFHSAVVDPEALKQLLADEPAEALALLLADLAGPQAPHDLREWVVGRGLMSAPAFDGWWRGSQQAIADDPRLELAGGRVDLHGRSESVDGSLDNPLLSAEARIALARELRPRLGEHAYVNQVVQAMRSGGARARSKAVEALEDVDPSYALARLAGPSAVELDALVHALEHAPWRPADVALEVHDRLFARVLQPLEQEHPLEGEGRLAGALTRWGAPDVAARLCRAASSHGRGPLLVESALSALPAALAEPLALDMLRSASGDPHTVAFLADRLIAVARRPGHELARQLESEDRRVLAVAVRRAADRRSERSTRDRRARAPRSEPDGQPLAALGDRAPSVEALGLELARTVARHHANQRLAYPTRQAIRVHPGGRVGLQAVAPGQSRGLRPDQSPSTASDVYTAGIALLEQAMGRAWSDGVSPERVLPHLRHLDIPLAPTTLAPLESALDPSPRRRPDAFQWLQRWEAATRAERRRADAEHRASVRLRVGFDTHIGRLKILQSQTNQDAVYVSTKGSHSLLAVCDGISTATAGSGDLAAAITAQVLSSLWDRALPRVVEAPAADVVRFIDKSLEAANRAVCEAAIRLAGGAMEGQVPMGTTAVVAVARGNRIHLAWLGDSRAYLIGPYGAALLTADQNQAGNRLVDWHAGRRPHWDPAGYALVGYLGHFDEDLTPRLLSPGHASLTLLPGERLLLCSDGLTDYLGQNHPEVADALCALALGDDDLEEVARSLVNAANRGGGGDNASAVIATLGD